MNRDPTDDLFAIGEVAERAGVPTSTLRYYDRIGLVRPAARRSGQRRYRADALRRLDIIAMCRTAGFSLEEIAELLDGGGDVQRLAAEKRAELDRRIAELRAARRLVDAALACGCAHLESCGRTAHPASAGT